MTRRTLRYIDKRSLLRALECARTVLHRAPAAIASYPELDSLIRELWECAHVTSPIAEESLLEVSLIKTMFDTPIIRASSETNRALVDVLSEARIQLALVSSSNGLLNLHRLARRQSSYAKERDRSPQLLQTHSDKDISAHQIFSPHVNGSSTYLWILSTLPPAKNQSLLLRLQLRGSLMRFAPRRQSSLTESQARAVAACY